MRYKEFEKIISPARLSRYKRACGEDTRKTMMLYRWNLRLAQELFTIISCFEVSLRNAIDNHLLNSFGQEWLISSANDASVFNNRQCRLTKRSIDEAVQRLGHNYSHNKLVAELGFGFWRYMFASHQYTATGRTLLRIFPAKPISSPNVQYNQNYVFNRLAEINELRNRIAHHEPICFRPRSSVIDTFYVRQRYGFILQLFQWMNINEADFLYGLDHINTVCDKIDNIPN